MLWANFLHIYQPPDQKNFILDKVINESYRAIISILNQNPHARITLSIIGTLLSKLDTSKYRDVIDGFIFLFKRNQIELTAGTMYHPFLPKLPENEIIRQINLNNDIQRYFFGTSYNPQGFYSPEAGYSYKVAQIAHSMGYSWTIVDEIAYSGFLSQRSYNFKHTPGFYSGGQEIREIVGQISESTTSNSAPSNKTVDYTKLYRIKGLDNFLVHFRERVISDALASGQITSSKQFLKVIKPEQSSNRYLLTGTDGEAYGHHQKKLDHVLGQLYHLKSLKTITISELPQHFPIKESIKPIPSTWGTSEQEIKEKNYYARWHHLDNAIHDKQWQLTNLAITTINRQNEPPTSTQIYPPPVSDARKLLDKALYSCHYWWASARPWWSIELIERGARMLADSVALAEGYNQGIRQVESKNIKQGNSPQALKLYQDIVFTAFDWLRTEKVWDLSHLHS